jgi:hypothetical protein
VLVKVDLLIDIIDRFMNGLEKTIPDEKLVEDIKQL